MLLGENEGSAGFALRIERVKRLLQALVRGFSGVDGATQPSRMRRVGSRELGICGALLRACTGSHETEEARTRPMGPCNLLGDLREGRVACPGIFKAVLRHGDGVRAALPFAHEPSTWLQSKARIWGNPTHGLEHLR